MAPFRLQEYNGMIGVISMLFVFIIYFKTNVLMFECFLRHRPLLGQRAERVSPAHEGLAEERTGDPV